MGPLAARAGESPTDTMILRALWGVTRFCGHCGITLFLQNEVCQPARFNTVACVETHVKAAKGCFEDSFCDILFWHFQKAEQSTKTVRPATQWTQNASDLMRFMARSQLTASAGCRCLVVDDHFHPLHHIPQKKGGLGMTETPAVCPLCAQVCMLDPDILPQTVICVQCGAALSPRRHGAAVLLEPNARPETQEKPEVLALLAQAEKERKPDRAHALMEQALAMDGESFATHRALLYHGRLYETARRPGDFTLIKSYLLHRYEEPDRYTPAQRAAIAEELFALPLLLRTCALSGDAEACMDAYLRHLTGEYLRLFIRGRTSVSNGVFGFSRPLDSVRRACAAIWETMSEQVCQDTDLTSSQREKLQRAMEESFDAEFR